MGYAIAAKNVILACSANHKKFQFDVQHRKILTCSESTRDFKAFQSLIIQKLKSLLDKQDSIEALESNPSTLAFEGFSPQENAAMVCIGQNIDNPNDFVSAWSLRQDMGNSGFTNIATTPAIFSLTKNKLIIVKEDADYNGNSYTCYYLDNAGIEWLLKNQDWLVLRIASSNTEPPKRDADALCF